MQYNGAIVLHWRLRYTKIISKRKRFTRSYLCTRFYNSPYETRSDKNDGNGVPDFVCKVCQDQIEMEIRFGKVAISTSRLYTYTYIYDNKMSYRTEIFSFSIYSTMCIVSKLFFFFIRNLILSRTLPRIGVCECIIGTLSKETVLERSHLCPFIILVDNREIEKSFIIDRARSLCRLISQYKL